MNIPEILNKKDGYAFMVLEEMFWIEVINEALKKSKGNVLAASENLGISPVTLRNRCTKHGINIKEHKVRSYKEREDRKETRKYWEFVIKKAFTGKDTTIHQAAENVGWSSSTMYRRMSAIGIVANGKNTKGEKA